MLWGHRLSVCILTLVVSGPSQLVELIRVDIPEQEEINRDVSLKCLFELHLPALLYSVKWYKDGSEFYRYLPGETPPAQAFSLPGISVNVCKILCFKFILISSFTVFCKAYREGSVWQVTALYKFWRFWRINFYDWFDGYV